MNKRTFNHRVAIMAMSLMAATGFTACSDDDNNGGSEVEAQKVKEMSTLTEKYVNDVVYYTYDKLADASEKLYDEVEAMRSSLAAGTLTQQQIDQTCATFLEARAWWEKSEAWLYGPAENWGIDPHIDTWPLSRPGLATFLRENKNTINEKKNAGDMF